MVRKAVDQLKTNKQNPPTNSQPSFVTPLLAVKYKEETLKDCMSARIGGAAVQMYCLGSSITI